MDKKALEAAAATYLRAAAAAVAALYMSGITDPKTLLNAFVAGLLGPLAKALNPKDHHTGSAKRSNKKGERWRSKQLLV